MSKRMEKRGQNLPQRPEQRNQHCISHFRSFSLANVIAGLI
jgi:hypothetical protein